MIKWDWFWKLLKPLFTILLIGFFGLLGNSFVNSAWIIRPNWVYWFSTLDNTINLEVNNKWQLMSEKIWNTKKMLAFSSTEWHKIYFFWSFNQKPYFYVNYDRNVYQWFLEYYYLCDYFTWESIWWNCARINIDDNFVNTVSNFFQSITVDDLWWYNIFAWHGCWIPSSSRPILVNQVAFWSSRFDKVIMFSAWWQWYDGTNCTCTDCNNTTWSLWFLDSIDFTFIDDNYLNNPPWMSDISSWVVEWSTWVDIVDTYTWDYTYKECTNWKIMNYNEKVWLSPYLCQWWLDNWDLFSSTWIYNVYPWSWKRLDEIYWYTNDNQTAKEWFKYWNNVYVNRYVSNSEIWNNKPAVLRSYFSIYNDYWWNDFDFETVYEYCLMRKFYTWDHSFASKKYNWTYFRQTCNFINDWWWGGGSNSITNSTTSSWETVVGLNWNWVWNLSWNKSYDDPWIFITDMFTKIKSYIPTDFSWIWFLPTYIITFLLFLILFRFISH